MQVGVLLGKRRERSEQRRVGGEDSGALAELAGTLIACPANAA